MFPIITKEIQTEFEKQSQNIKYISCICGFRGRACRQLGKPEGANRMPCTKCDLKLFAEKL